MFSTVTLAVCRLVDQSVVSLHQCACSLRGARDGAQRMLRQVARARHQTRAQARIAQRCAAELVRRPGLGVEPVAKRQRHHARCGHRQAFPPRRLQFIHIHCLARLGRRMGAVLTTAPRGLTYAHPVRRPPTRPGVLALVNERLQQPGPIAVTALEVRAHCPHHPTQDVRSQVAARYPGADQKPAQSHHPVQLVAAPRVVPANPGIARLQAPRGGRKADATQPAVRGAHQIAQLMADPRPRATRVLVCHQRVPDQALRVALDQHQLQIPEPAHRSRHRARRRHRLRQHPRLAQHPATAPRRWQRNLARCFQLGQRLAATRALQPPAAIAEIERFTDPIDNPPDALDAARGSAVQHLAQAGKIGPQGAPYLILNLHADYGSEAASQSSATSYGAGVALGGSGGPPHQGQPRHSDQGAGRRLASRTSVYAAPSAPHL